VNTGSTVTNAVIAGAVDNYGYIVLNGTKYPSTNVHSDKGYEGFNNIIQPFTVTIPRGPNTLEVRCVNSSSGVTAAQNNGAITNPAGMWLTIKVNNNFIVKTGCDGWKCTRFFYPQEVFHVVGDSYNKKQDEASAVCQKVGARVATYAELDESQKNHANWCSGGWVSDKGDKNAFYPITYQTIPGCAVEPGVKLFYGDDNWFGGAGKGFRAGVNCFGNKPEQGAITRAILPDTTIGPYNKNQWSRYSPGTSPPVVIPPLPPVTINQHCGGDGWSRTLTGPKVFNSGADYPSDVSFIRVPSGVTVVISYNGRSFTIVGPRNFNACGGSGDWYFNDKMTTIEIRATGSSDANSAATPPPAPPRNIIIESATYGGNCGTGQNNVTASLQNTINRQADKTLFTYTGPLNNLFGDPVPYCPKDFKVSYNLSDGKSESIYLHAKVGEHHTLSLPGGPSSPLPLPGLQPGCAIM
jgi:hypothetical protein